MAYNKYAPKIDELKTLQQIRDDAKTPEEKQKAQNDIDIFFLGEPKKKNIKKKKQKKSYTNYDDDEWDDWD
jgi:hypothetical protein